MNNEKPTYDQESGFSNHEREAHLLEASSDTFALIVIGGGITGAGIALDASLRGIKTLLLEKSDFASGTSSRSTKLIHGGLRYLKKFEIGLVRESGKERRIVHENIPHLVHPERMLLPIVKEGTFSRWTASIAISIYDRLADVQKKNRKAYHTREESMELEPLLNNDILKSSLSYTEYRTDDARLTIEIIKAARREGATCLNYTEVSDFIDHEGKVSGVEAKDAASGKNYTFRSGHIVSAAGPWSDIVHKLDEPQASNMLYLTKGSHIVVPAEKLPIRSPVYFDAFDGRMIFAIPRNDKVYIGTTDTFYSADPEKVVVSREDILYLMAATNKMFNITPLEVSDVISHWAGLRPLIRQEGKEPTDISRKDEVFISPSGIITIAGGKLTGYRKMAERIVDLIQISDPDLPRAHCLTKNYKIHRKSYSSYHDFEEDILRLHSASSLHGMDYKTCQRLLSNYGSTGWDIFRAATKIAAPEFKYNLLKAEILHCLNHEAALFPEDYFIRRSGRLFFYPGTVHEYFDFIHEVFAEYYKWTEIDLNKIKERSREIIYKHTGIN